MLVHDPLHKSGEDAGLPGEIVLGVGGDCPGHRQLHVLGRKQGHIGLGLPLNRLLLDPSRWNGPGFRGERRFAPIDLHGTKAIRRTDRPPSTISPSNR